ncbi:MAG: primosomal protein N', partial [Bacteroides sp.]|nr:primosomal protein N' [Bacteroides sp.]
MNKYAEIILPLPLNKTFTYAIPSDFQGCVNVGYRVVVPFGVKKYYTGIVYSMHDVEPQGYEVKSIEYLLDDSPIVNFVQMELWQWIASYYMCAVGDVYKAALPSGLKVESESVVEMNDDYEGESNITEKEKKVLLWLQNKGRAKVNDIFKHVDVKAPLSVIKSLLEKEIIKVTEELKESYRPKTEVMVKLADGITEQGLNILLGSMNRSPRQRDLILSYLNLSALFSSESVRQVSKKQLLDKAGCSSSVFTSLAERGI